MAHYWQVSIASIAAHFFLQNLRNHSPGTVQHGLNRLDSGALLLTNLAPHYNGTAGEVSIASIAAHFFLRITARITSPF